MVLNRPWPGQIIYRIYYLLYLQSPSGSCPESRIVFGDCPLGRVCAACQQSCWEQTRPAGAERRKATSPPLGKRAGPSGFGEEGRVSPAPACGHHPAWHQRAGMAQCRQCVCPGQGCWFRIVQGSCFWGNTLLPNSSFTDGKAPNLAVLSLKAVSCCHLFPSSF